MSKLAGKSILITGASQGLGRAMALRFAREGAVALSLVARHADKLNAVRDEVLKIAPKIDIVVIEADVSKPGDIERVVATTLAQFKGVLDVLVNNASTIGPSPMPFLLDYPVEDFREVLDTNLIGPFLLIKNALPAMIERDASIINVTSDAGQVGYPGWGAYGISKFGLEGMSQTWASELEETGVRVNWVDPGSMNTAMHRAAEPEEDPSEWANPAEVTDVFVFLASDESKDVTGKRFQAQEDWKAELSAKAEDNH
jgi:NAD(P)-dependent dehydrogenase (short-subunit alcohol dehydrogenase family)